jgi:D-sedoheptulose 7-phosphate isomerase
MDYTKDIQLYIELEKQILDKLDLKSINEMMNLIQETYEKKKTIFIFGNGGSSATASHYQNDFNKGLSEDLEKKFRVVCLNNDLPTIMAIANDFSFEEVFRYQLTDRLETGDIVIAISGSGNSANIIRAVEYAKESGNKVIGLCGYDGGKLKRMADICVHVSVDNMQITEDVHMMLDHLMVTVFHQYLSDR